jgi:hypothetical protein
MGHHRHHAIIVNGFQAEAVAAAHAEASRIFPSVTPIVASVCNGFSSFLVPPDGSKEGWEDSHAGDARRHDFKEWLGRSISAGMFLEWVEVRFGGDDNDAAIEDHADAGIDAALPQ